MQVNPFNNQAPVSVRVDRVSSFLVRERSLTYLKSSNRTLEHSKTKMDAWLSSLLFLEGKELQQGTHFLTILSYISYKSNLQTQPLVIFS